MGEVLSQEPTPQGQGQGSRYQLKCPDCSSTLRTENRPNQKLDALGSLCVRLKVIVQGVPSHPVCGKPTFGLQSDPWGTRGFDLEGGTLAV